jgi:hypothetical protein
MYHRKMEKQMNNVKSVRTPMLPEPSDDNKSSLLLPQAQANNRLTPDKSTPTLEISTCGTSCPTTVTS